jgi:hypothetical protein
MGTKALKSGDLFSSARAKLEKWRLGGRRGRRIPQEVWSEAVELARVQGVSKTSMALGLDYYGLQRRLDEDSETAVATGDVEAPAFVELTLGGRGAPDCVLVVDVGPGRQLRIELRGAATSRLESLALALASVRSCP